MVLDDWTITSQGIALYFPQNRHMPVALRLFVDTVKAQRASEKPDQGRSGAAKGLNAPRTTVYLLSHK
jgi:hypothetical protein